MWGDNNEGKFFQLLRLSRYEGFVLEMSRHRYIPNLIRRRKRCQTHHRSVVKKEQI